MADKRIDQLTAATSLTAVDLMVTEQSGVAKKVTGNILANSAWNMMQKDASPTKDSTAPVTSGAVYDALGGAFSPTKLATPGSLVHIEDGAYNQPIQGMKIAINPVQSGEGDPSPDNVRPISGWTGCTLTRTGKNLLNTSKYQFNAKTVYLGISTSPTKGYIYLTAGTYSLSAETLVISKFFIQADGEAAQGLGSGTTNPQVSFTVVEDNYYKIWLYQNSQLLISDIKWVQLEKNPTVTAYEPYKGNVYELSFAAAGTVYGGYLTYNGDGTWTLTVDHYTMTVTGADITATINLGDVIRTNLVYVESGKNATGRNALAISNWLPRIAANYSGNAMGFYFDTESRVYIKAPNNAIGITSETSVGDRLALTKAYFDANPLLIVYPLATALSFTLTGPEVLTLLGINNIWADTGDIEELAYRADIGLYLTEALNPIKEMLAYREDTMKATRAYTTGDFIVVGDTFYKAATAIANGATLTPGTNVNATTVGAQLKLLS